MNKTFKFSELKNGNIVKLISDFHSEDGILLLIFLFFILLQLLKHYIFTIKIQIIRI